VKELAEQGFFMTADG